MSSNNYSRRISGHICNECGCDPADLRGYRVKERNGGDRFAFKIWILFVIVFAVLALPWVQVRLGNRFAIHDFRKPREPRLSQYPLIDPVVRWGDMVLIAEGDEEATLKFREAIGQYDGFFQRKVWSNNSDFSFDVVFDERSCRLTRTMDEELALRIRLKSYRGDSEFVGWPNRWITRSKSHKFAYQETEKEDEMKGLIDEPVIHREVDIRTRYSWENILISIGLLCMLSYGIWRVCIWKGMGERKSFAVVSIFFIVSSLGMFFMALNHPRSYGSYHSVYGYESLAANDPQVWDSDEMLEAVGSDDGIRAIARSSLEAFGEMKRANALVSLSEQGRFSSSSYSLNYGLTSRPFFAFTSTEFFHMNDEKTFTHAPIPWENIASSISLKWQGLSIRLAPGKAPASLYNIRIDLLRIGVYVFGFFVVLKILRGIIGIMYRMVQRRRKRRNVCIWCKYPLSE